MQQLQDPKIALAMQLFAKDAKKALTIYKDDDEVAQFFKDYLSLMNQHYPNDIEKKKKNQKAPLIEEIPSKDMIQFGQRYVEKQQVEQWLSNPQIRYLLNHPEIISILNKLQVNPSLITQYLQHPGIKVLIQHNILALPSA